MKVKAYVRDDGTVGVRNHILILPSVVCANQVAREVAEAVPGAVYVEHQHGCAQIGADFDQTKRVFVNMALHPNVFGVVVIGLGCEAVAAQLVAAEISAHSKKPVVPLIIQESGGTLGAKERGIEAAQKIAAAAIGLISTEVDVDRIAVSLQIAGSQPPTAVTETVYQSLVQQVSRYGFGTVVARDDGAATAHIGYAERVSGAAGIAVMQAPHHEAEQLTGLVASGAQLAIVITDDLTLIGSPIAPVWTLCTDEGLWNDLSQEFDAGCTDGNAANFTKAWVSIIEGERSNAERQGLVDFAIHRVGPTI